MEKLNFGQAIEALKKGKLVARSGWNGKGMFLFIRPEASVPVEMVKTLPEQVKEHFRKNVNSEEAVFTGYICMKAADESIVNGWLASQTDILAEDWVVLDHEENKEITDQERIEKPLSELFSILADLAKSQNTLHGRNSEDEKLTNVAIEELMYAKNAIKIAFKLQ